MMRYVLGAVIGVVAFVCLAFIGLTVLSEPAEEQRAGVDVESRTCAAALAPENHANAAAMLIWLAGYHAKPGQRAIVDPAAIRADSMRTLEYCRANGSETLLAASAHFMGRNATAPGAGSVDLSGIDCKFLLAADAPEDKTRAGHYIFWLAGRYAAASGTRVMNEAQIFKRIYEASRDCQISPESKLVPIAERHLQTSAG